MSETHDYIVKAKHILPMKAGEMENVLKMKCTLIHMDPSIMITDIATSDNMAIHRGCLYIPYHESDQECAEAITKGAVAVLTDHEIENIPCIVVEDSKAAVYRLCELFEENIQLPSILVAGSEGKTTTKRLVKRVLQQKYDVFSQDGNFNSLHGLCCSLQGVETSAEIIVQEVDESRTGNTADCSSILKPDIVLVTNIAEAHIGHLGGKDNLIKSFLGLTAGLRENGFVILNADDIDSMDAGFQANILTVGIDYDAADCLATNIQEKPGGLEFDASFQGKTTHINLSVHGIHNVYNAMMAFVVGKLKGVPEKDILKGLRGFRNVGIRQNVVRIGGVLVYADCYNASLRSVDYALKCFCALPKKHGKRIAVLGDIAELEGYEEDTYGGIAQLIDQSNLDGVITCGKTSEMILEKVTRDCLKKHTANRTELNAVLRELNQQEENSYLFKASRIMELEKSIQAVFPQHYRIMAAQERDSRRPRTMKTVLKSRLRMIDASLKHSKSRR